MFIDLLSQQLPVQHSVMLVKGSFLHVCHCSLTVMCLAWQLVPKYGEIEGALVNSSKRSNWPNSLELNGPCVPFVGLNYITLISLSVHLPNLAINCELECVQHTCVSIQYFCK